jgi:hypothetical protein
MMTNQSRRDEMILVSMSMKILIPKGWHDSCGGYDTPSGLVNNITISITLPLLRSLGQQT